MRSIRPFAPAAALLALLVCPMATAQTTIEPPIVSPGARSLGLGGAFVAVADDATAAWSNPSGLTQLVRPEISAEGRSWSENRESEASNQSRLGFLSFVLPRRNWAIAVYGQTLSSLDFPEQWEINNPEPTLLSGLVVANAGVSAAVRLTDAVSIGFGLTAFAGVFSGGTFDPSSSYPFWGEETQSEMGGTAGVLWNLSEAWALGASFRSGADFAFAEVERVSIPDILAAGARWRSAGGHLTLAAEAEHLAGIEERNRLHLGGEWVFLQSRPLIGLRAGLWHDPNGGVVTSTADGGATEADEVVHASTGIGLAWRKFQLDLGADFSNRTTITAVSVIFTF